MLKLLFLLATIHLTFAQYWFGNHPPPPPPPHPGMVPYPAHGMPLPPPPPPMYPGMTVVQGPPQVEISRTVIEKKIPSNQPSTLCVCTEASNCRITPKYRCQGSSVILEGGGGDGVCCPEPEIIC